MHPVSEAGIARWRSTVWQRGISDLRTDELRNMVHWVANKSVVCTSLYNGTQNFPALSAALWSNCWAAGCQPHLLISYKGLLIMSNPNAMRRLNKLDFRSDVLNEHVCSSHETPFIVDSVHH